MRSVVSLLREKYIIEGTFPKVKESSDSEKCEICGNAERARVKICKSTLLCCPCFRVLFLENLETQINNPTRSKNARELIAKLEKLSMVTSGFSEEDKDVYHPSQVASTRMPSSRLPSFTQNTWICPLCTATNSTEGIFEPCNVCGFILTLKATVCGECNVNCILPEGAQCKDGLPHSLWFCERCRELHTRDADACPSCKAPKMWICGSCLQKNTNARNKEGLRKCSSCETLCTLNDVKQGEIAHRVTQEVRNRAKQLKFQKNADDFNIFALSDDETIREQNRQNEIALNLKRLNDRIELLGVDKRCQASDGNCMFASLSHQLFGKEKHACLVRFLVVEYMSRNKEEYGTLFDGENGLIEYLSEMVNPGVWGDELCLNAAARFFKVDIHVIGSTEGSWYRVFRHANLACSMVPHGRIANPPESVSLFLAYHFPVHYEDIALKGIVKYKLSSLSSRLRQLQDNVAHDVARNLKEEKKKL